MGSESRALAFVAFWNALGSASDLDNVVRFARSLPAHVPLVQDEDGIWIPPGGSREADQGA